MKYFLKYVHTGTRSSNRNPASSSLYKVLQNGSTRVMAEHFVSFKAIRFVTGSIKIRVNFGPRPSTGARLGLKLSFVI